jgi:hypothetical protein
MKLYRDYRIIALFPAVCVIIDYALTFYLAGDTSMITSWEASPFVRYAVIHDVMAVYLIGIVLFYYGHRMRYCASSIVRITTNSGSFSSLP